jgi:hypothetical protein
MINSPAKILFLNKDIILFCVNYQDGFLILLFSTFVFSFWRLVFDELLRFLGCWFSCLWSFWRICLVVLVFWWVFGWLDSLFLFWGGEIGLWLGWFDWLLAGCVGLDKRKVSPGDWAKSHCPGEGGWEWSDD